MNDDEKFYCYNLFNFLIYTFLDLINQSNMKVEKTLFSLAPLDRFKLSIKIRVFSILTTELSTPKSLKYNGMINCFTVIVEKEGIKSLYYG